MSLPTINTYHVDHNGFGIYWKASPASVIKKWNLYGATEVTIDFTLPAKGISLPGSFTLIQEGIPNYPNSLTPGSVFVQLNRSDLSLDEEDPYFVLITGLDANGLETPMEVSNVHNLNFLDQTFVDEAGWPVNVIYGQFEFDLPQVDWDVDRYLDIISLIGRPAKEIKIHTDKDILVKFNNYKAYQMTITSTDPFDLKRGELQVNTVYLKNAGTLAKVKVFVAG